jgi:hypothetical protein
MYFYGTIALPIQEDFCNCSHRVLVLNSLTRPLLRAAWTLAKREASDETRSAPRNKTSSARRVSDSFRTPRSNDCSRPCLHPSTQHSAHARMGAAARRSERRGRRPAPAEGREFDQKSFCGSTFGWTYVMLPVCACALFALFALFAFFRARSLRAKRRVSLRSTAFHRVHCRAQPPPPVEIDASPNVVPRWSRSSSQPPTKVSPLKQAGLERCELGTCFASPSPAESQARYSPRDVIVQAQLTPSCWSATRFMVLHARSAYPHPTYPTTVYAAICNAAGGAAAGGAAVVVLSGRSERREIQQYY